MSQIEVSPGGVGFIRTPVQRDVPGVPAGAKRKSWVTGLTASRTQSPSSAARKPRTSGGTR